MKILSTVMIYSIYFKEKRKKGKVCYIIEQNPMLSLDIVQ